MTDAETQTAQQPAPPCERCGTTTFPSRREMKSHGLDGNKAIPRHKVVETWRCPRCGQEAPRG